MLESREEEADAHQDSDYFTDEDNGSDVGMII